jgi:hypothetical protein
LNYSATFNRTSNSSFAALKTTTYFEQLAANARIDFTIGVMPCIPDRGPGTWSSSQLYGQFWWDRALGMPKGFVKVDAMIKNYSLGENPPWQVLATDVDNNFIMYFDHLQCKPFDIAFRARLAAPGTLEVTCPEVSSAFEGVQMTLQPVSASIVDLRCIRATDTTYIINMRWRESANLGGCGSARYRLTVLSLYVSQYIYFEYFETSGYNNSDIVHTWLVPNATLQAGVQYMAIIDVWTDYAQGSSVSSLRSIPHHPSHTG